MNNVNTRRDTLKYLADQADVFMSTYSPGDGHTRYRFFRKIDPALNQSRQDYFSGDGLTTVMGSREAEVWLRGYLAGTQAL